jgi:hypothetical protein
MTRRARTIANAAGWDEIGPNELARSAALHEAPKSVQLMAEAQTAADLDPGARHELAYLTPELIAGAATARRNMAAWEAEETRPLTPEEHVSYLAIVEAERDRLGLETLAETLDVINPIPKRFTRVATAKEPAPFPEPEDRGTATLSALGGVEYVDDLIRPGRIVVVAAEEGAGKSYAIGGELAVRVAVAGGSFAGTWPVLRTGPVLYMSEMHPTTTTGERRPCSTRSGSIGRPWRGATTASRS